MKVHKLFSVVLLVVCSAMLLAAPVQAGRATTPVTFQITDMSIGYTERMAGPISQRVWLIEGPVASDDGRLVGYLTWNLYVTCVWPNAHNASAPPDLVWGPVSSDWQIVTSAPGEPLSGWRGTAHTRPQIDPAKWEGINNYRATGNGFGLYRSLHIEWRLDPNDMIFVGEISEAGQ